MTATLLRIYLLDPLLPERACDWVLLETSGKILERGTDSYERWPSATRRDAIIAAARVRIAVVRLPRMAHAKLAAAAAFAMEEQLAGPLESQHLAIGNQDDDGSVHIAILDSTWFKAVASSAKAAGITFHRVLAEPDLAPHVNGEWMWCARAPDVHGFVRFSSGASINVGPACVTGDAALEPDPLPSELSLALRHTGSANVKPATVRVAMPSIPAQQLAHWSESSGIAFVAAKPWRWEEVSTAIADLIDLPLVEPIDSVMGRARANESQARGLRAFRPAAIIAGLALFIHVAATFGEWSMLKLKSLRLNAQMNDIAQQVGAVEIGNTPAPSLVAAKYSEVRHRAGLLAPDDFLSLLARSAPALQTLPSGTVRALSYADKHILLELKAIDSERLARLQRDLARLDLPNLAAPTPSGPRVRFGIE